MQTFSTPNIDTAPHVRSCAVVCLPLTFPSTDPRAAHVTDPVKENKQTDQLHDLDHERLKRLSQKASLQPRILALAVQEYKWMWIARVGLMKPRRTGEKRGCELYPLLSQVSPLLETAADEVTRLLGNARVFCLYCLLSWSFTFLST